MTKTFGKCLYNVNLTGGEPFLREDIFEVVSAYFENSTVKSIVITTNGILITAVRSFLDKFVESDLKGRVKISISIDNFEEKHDANRNVVGAFGNALQTYKMVEAYRDIRIMADIALTVTPYNFMDVYGLYSYLRQIGINHVTAILMREEGAVKSIEKKSAVMEAYERLASLIQSDRITRKGLPAKHVFQEMLRKAKNAIVKEVIAPAEISARSLVACRAGSLFGVIYSNGDVFPCEIIDRSWSFGNLKDCGLNFLDLWRQKKSSSLRKSLRKLKCNCTYECALSVNVLSTPAFIPGMLAHSCFDLIWNKKTF